MLIFNPRLLKKGIFESLKPLKSGLKFSFNIKNLFFMHFNLYARIIQQKKEFDYTWNVLQIHF